MPDTGLSTSTASRRPSGATLANRPCPPSHGRDVLAGAIHPRQRGVTVRRQEGQGVPSGVKGLSLTQRDTVGDGRGVTAGLQRAGLGRCAAIVRPRTNKRNGPGTALDEMSIARFDSAESMDAIIKPNSVDPERDTLYKTRLSPGNARGQKWPVSPCSRFGSVNGTAAPPLAGTFRSPLVRLGEKTIVSPMLHVSDVPSSTGSATLHTVSTGPPSARTFLSTSTRRTRRTGCRATT